MHARAAQTYQRVDLESAPKIQIVDRLFRRFADDAAAARAALAAGDVRGKAAAIDHALQIVAELTAALDPTASPELCANLASLYGFVQAQLGDASARRDPAALERATCVMAELGDAFAQVHQGGAR
ncbi:MAG: flagellar export chaperone FliS [Kofleriaceae bacterium]